MKKGFVLLIGLVALFFFLNMAVSCGDDDDDDSSIDDDDDDSADDDDDSEPWVPVEPHRETRGAYTVVWLAGTPYDMGYQQGELLMGELAAGVEWLNSMGLIDLLIPIARALGLVDLAMDNSYPDIVEECRGMVDAAGEVGWSMDVCMLLNFGDVLVEFLTEGFPHTDVPMLGCSEIAGTGAATVDGRLYHGRILDWSKIDFLLDYPVVFVRQPSDGIPHAFIGFPGNLSPYQGMNAEGVSIASNEADPFDDSQHDRTGRSHVQMLAQLLKNAHSLQEVRTTVLAEDHMTVELIMVADGIAREAAVFEMTARAIGVREFENDVLFATNHFVAPETMNADEEPAGTSSLLRYDRLTQLIAPGGDESRWGEIGPQSLIEVMRDRVNPWTGEEVPLGTFDNDGSLATNGALYQIVFDPENLLFWVAAGDIPVPEQPFTCFSLGELLNLPDAVPCEPEVIP